MVDIVGLGERPSGFHHPKDQKEEQREDQRELDE
jgi:hypothetical protein